LSQTLRYVPFSQTKIDLFNEVNFSLTKEELNEAVVLSGYTKKDKVEFTKEVDVKELTNTARMWACALKGVWKTMLDVDGWKLPATFNKYNICGKGFYKICEGKTKFARRFVYHCGRIGCEVCAKRAGSRIAKKIERRIWLYGLKVKFETKGRKNPLPSHVIEAIDPKDDFWNWKKEKQIQTLKKIRILAGIKGGAEINHLWAFDKSDLKPFYRPHKHLIAYGWIKPNASELIKKEFGINLIYHKVRNGTLRSRVDVFAVAFYQLSHAAIKQNKHSIKWFGDLAYNKISNAVLNEYNDQEYLLQDIEIERTKRCPYCYNVLVPAKINYLFKKWRDRIHRIDGREKGCKFKGELFISVDFIEGEKMPYYDENHKPFFKQTIAERKIVREIKRPDLYIRKTKNQQITLPLTPLFRHAFSPYH